MLAIRTMVVCHRRVAFKRSIPLANITSVHVPQSEVFDRSLSLRANGKLMFLTAVSTLYFICSFVCVCVSIDLLVSIDFMLHVVTLICVGFVD